MDVLEVGGWGGHLGGGGGGLDGGIGGRELEVGELESEELEGHFRVRSNERSLSNLSGLA